MFDRIIRYFRDRKLRKYASPLATGLVPLSDIRTVNAVVDVEETGFDLLKEDILAWGKSNGLKVNIYFFDFRKLGKDELLLTTIDKTLLRKGLDWLGTPNVEKISSLMEEKSDLFISMIDNNDFPIEFISKCARARFKIGRREYDGHPFNMILSGGETADLRSEARQIFAAITEFITKIR